MSYIRLGVVTFGESGAVGVTTDLEECLPGYIIREIGLLDGLPAAVLDEWSVVGDGSSGDAGGSGSGSGDTRGSGDATVVHLRDGTEVTLRSPPLMARIPAAIAALGAAHPDVMLYGCAGPLPEFAAPCQTLHPSALLRSFLDAVLPTGRVGIVVPSPVHVNATMATYSSATRSVECRAAPPSDASAVAAALASVGGNGVDLLVLACFDHTLDDLETARRSAASPVISSRGLAITAITALFGLTPANGGRRGAPCA